ncbi:MAG: hypothetical protein WBQ86_22650 [Candidatus Binatus sp.]
MTIAVDCKVWQALSPKRKLIFLPLELAGSPALIHYIGPRELRAAYA